MRRLMLLMIAVAVGLTGCGRAATPTSTGPSSTPLGSSTPPGESSPAPGESSPAPMATTPATWTTQPVSVTRSVAVPPVPRLTDIRWAQHPDEGYDRVVFEFVSVLPGYDVRYVDAVIADGSGQPVAVPGQRHLKVTFRPARAHDESGAGVARSMTLGLPSLKAYAITGDFEGVLTVVLGTDDVAGFRIVDLPGTPGRIAIDVAA